MNETIIKSQETKDGVKFRILKDSKYYFVDVPFKNYFYVKAIDYDMHSEEFHTVFNFCIEKVESLGQFKKIILSNNFMRNKTKSFWDNVSQTYEADIKANKRYLLDTNMELNNSDIPYTFFDIETDDRLPLQKDERGNVLPRENARILSFAAVDYKGEKISFALNSDCDEDEKALLETIINYFSKYGVISGWYSEFFDMPYIKNRCDRLNVNYDILDYVNHLDYKEIFIKYDKKSRGSYSLNAISNEVLNESKIDQPKGEGRIYKAWQENLDHLIAYNIEDSNLIYKINAKLMFIEVSMKRADNAGCHVRSTMNNSDSGDYLLMREYKAENIIMPSKPTQEQAEMRKYEGKISGGFTRCLKPGFHKQVEVWDYKSFYPLTIATFNISPETYIETLPKHVKAEEYKDYIITPDNFNEETNSFHPKRIFERKMGVVPKVCLKLIEKRDVIKYTMDQYKETDPAKYKQLYLEQYALKTDANSIYGILSFVYSRYYSWHLGDSVTTSCQAIIKKSYSKLEEWGQTVIGGDTDSTFVVLNNATPEEIDNKFKEFYDEYFKEFNVHKHYIVFEHEKTVSPMLFVKKKNYAYKEGDSVIIKGLECIKSDSNPLAANLQKEFIMHAMNFAVKDDYWEDKVSRLYAKVFDQELKVSDLVLTKAMTKMPKDYEGYIIDKKTKRPKIKADGTLQRKSIPAHVKLAERMLAKGRDLYPGSKIKFIVIADKPILAIGPEEFELKSGEFPYKHKKKGEIIYQWEGDYAAKYYWLRIIKPLIKVIVIYYNNLPDWNWSLTKTEMKNVYKEDDETS